jgi:hypothetical protein
MFQRFAFFVVIAFLASACAHNEHAAAADNVSKSEGATPIEWTFEDCAVGAQPAGWSVAETNGAGKPGVWKVEEMAGAPSGKRVVRLAETHNSGSTFNLLLQEGTYGPNLLVEVEIHAESGAEDQGGGLVWRARDADNYYIARWNPLEKNLRAYKVEGAKRTMFKSVDVDADVAKWHELGVKMVGPEITVIFDDKPLIQVADGTFAASGKVGLWTKADAASCFDNFEVTLQK